MAILTRLSAKAAPGLAKRMRLSAKGAMGDLEHTIPLETVTKKTRRECRRGFNNIGFQPDCQLKVAFGNKNLYFAKVAFENKRNLYLLLRLSAKS